MCGRFISRCSGCGLRQQHYREPVGHAVTDPTPDLLNQNLHFDEIPGGYMCTLKFEKRWSRAMFLNFSCALEHLRGGGCFCFLFFNSDASVTLPQILDPLAWNRVWHHYFLKAPWGFWGLARCIPGAAGARSLTWK